MERVLRSKLMDGCPPEYQLHANEVPLAFRELGIKTGYRKPCCSLRNCLRSAFWPTNETLNFWTHFLPFWYFFGKFCELLGDQQFIDDKYHWAFTAYLATVCAWPMVSCFAHLFSVMSEEVRHVCFFIDYLSLSWYSYGAATVYHAYAFDELFFDTWFSRYYLYAVAIAACLCTFLACQSRFITDTKCRKFLRVLSFTLPYAAASLPLMERLARRSVLIGLAKVQPDAAFGAHCRQFFWALTGIVFYGFHIPEAFFPGKFDIVGHSHQILHICGIAATYYQLHACYTDMIDRRPLLDQRRDSVASVNLGLVIAVLVVNCVIVAAFMFRLYRISKKRV